jgi:aryl-alcohol dehydrogenase-like predicted oxidoreductase
VTSALLARPFGKTGLTVSALGLGAGRIGSDELDEADVGRLLDAAIDAGITLFDTARSYGLSEERIGRHLGHLGHRRDALVLSTKGGYGIPGYADWTGPCITAGIDAALARLRTDRIDIFHLHSCPLETLERGEVIAALDQAVRAGKIRVAAYSGDAAPLAWAVRSGRFGSVETSVNLCDQRGIDGDLPIAAARGLGVIGKRPLANAPWRFAERPVGDYAEVYWERLGAMGLDPGELAWDELALRFAAFQPGVSASIVGTASVEHLRKNAAQIARGPLPTATAQAIRAAFLHHDRDWIGQV